MTQSHWLRSLAVPGLAILALLGGGMTMPSFADTTTSPSINLALNKPASASTVAKSGFEASKAVDGDLKTRWSSVGNSDPQWLSVDLGSVYDINRVVLNWEKSYAKAFSVQTSTDGAKWNDIYSTATNTGGINNLTGLTGTGRYVRMNGTARATKYGYSLWEFEVYGAPVAAAVPSAAPVTLVVAGTKPLIAINCGGDTPIGNFSADANFDGGTAAANNTGPVDTTGVTNPAPKEIYQSERWGDFTYTLPGLVAGSAHKVRLHFTEDFVTQPGDRVFNVTINNAPALTNFDIFAVAKAENKAVVKEFDTTANKDGKIVIGFVSVTQSAKVDGIEVY